MSEYITPELFRFFKELRVNNEKTWFEENKSRFEKQVREPLLDFIRDFTVPLGAVSPHFRADPKKVGGSLFRIYRDTRFSKDKTPYKTHAGLHFRHEAAKDAHAPGFYLHLGPDDDVWAACGIWAPDTQTAGQIRKYIDDHQDAWLEARDDATFRKFYELTGSSLKRPPRGFDKEHPLIEDLKRKDFIAVSQLSQAEVCKPEFIVKYAERCMAASPFVRFLTKAVGQNF